MDKKIRKRDIFLKALALFVAIGLWVYVSYVEIPEIEVKYYNIPITYKNDDLLRSSQLIRDTDGETQYVTIKVRGKRSKIFSLSGHDITAKVDLSGLSYAKEYDLPVTITFPVDGFTVVDKKPYTVHVKLEKTVTKELPVTLNVVGEADASCEITKNTLSAKTISVTGPESVMNNAKSCVASVDISGLSEDKELPLDIKLKLNDGTLFDDDSKISFPGNQLTVSFEMDKTVKIRVQPSIENSSELSVKNIKVNPEEIEVSGAYKDIAKLGDYIGTEMIFLDGGHETAEYEVSLDVPEGINITGDSKKVTVEIELEKEEADE